MITSKSTKVPQSNVLLHRLPCKLERVSPVLLLSPAKQNKKRRERARGKNVTTYPKPWKPPPCGSTSKVATPLAFFDNEQSEALGASAGSAKEQGAGLQSATCGT